MFQNLTIAESQELRRRLASARQKVIIAGAAGRLDAATAEQIRYAGLELELCSLAVDTLS